MAMTIGISERLSRLIDTLGLTTYQFSKALGYDRPEKIYAVVNGKTKPSFDTLYCTKAFLFSDECDYLERKPPASTHLDSFLRE